MGQAASGGSTLVLRSNIPVNNFLVMSGQITYKKVESMHVVHINCI